MNNIENWDEQKKFFADKANNYRLHLDKLRYSLIGSYFVMWGVVMGFLRGDIGYKMAALVYCLMFFVGIICFFIMAIQNWHYNMYSLYVKETEIILQRDNRAPVSHADFSRTHYQDVTPMHDAFSFVFILMWITIAFNLANCMTNLFVALDVEVCGELVILGCFILVMFLGFLSMRYWRYVYKFISFCQKSISAI